MKNKIITIAAVVLCLAGVGLLIYPTVSDFINRIHSSRAIQELVVQMEDIPDEELMAQLEYAREYNDRIVDRVFADKNNSLKDYYEILDFANNMMGYIEIEKIDVKLPIYHGVSADVLSKGVGHLPQSTFPIGGEGYHAVLTAHTGLPSAELFTDLVELREGDVFKIYIANEELMYKVDQIKTILPEETEDIVPVPGEDYCTLVTCTPYGINSHRLLVRGTRIYSEDEIDSGQNSEDNSITFPIFPWMELTVFVLTSMSSIKHLSREVRREEEKG
ncbi:MAG: class C sortase [Clostridia bacterium]|nr:class C sortase [Clostridia bacterium]